MATNNTVPPDLSSLLSTLSRYAPHQTTPTPPLSLVQPHNVPPPPADWLPSEPIQAFQTPAQPPANVIDPATITEWSAGLRCVTKIATGDARFEHAVKKMMQNQRQNEVDWYSRRQQLKKDQSQRGHGSNELLDIMKSIGAATATTPSPAAKEANDKAELDDFDQKILRAQKHMNAAMTAELKALGVPFFGTAPELVVDDKQMVNSARSTSGPKWSQIITHQELLDLQRRMISYLEDMYKE